ncbi:MAG: hypothetical protein QM708_15805 [Propioniciclava sp.]|uniref:hypothetical protein n=1 Tax=Propioniciclava sp. TaxID=2038686 RepID=UPI0039E2740E
MKADAATTWVGLAAVAVLAGVLTSCSSVAGPRPSESAPCAETRGIAVDYVEGAPGAASAIEAADGFVDAKGLARTPDASWVVRDQADSFQVLESGSLTVRVGHSDAGWLVSEARECLRR